MYKEIKNKNCYLCNSENFHVIHNGVRGDSEIDVLECDSCGLVRLSSFISETDEFYKQSGMRENGAVDLKEIRTTAFVDDNRRYQFVNRMIENKNVLDFGCGAGGFLHLAKQSAKHVCGIELEQVMCDCLNNEGIDCYASLDEAENSCGEFDYITLFHVLEHLEDPIDILHRLTRLKRKTGKIIIEVPNANDALLSLYKSEAFADFTYWKCHLYLYTMETLNSLVRKSGMKVLFMQQIQRYSLSNHLYWLSQKLPGGHAAWASLSDDILDKVYGDKLAKLGIADTIIAVIQ